MIPRLTVGIALLFLLATFPASATIRNVLARFPTIQAAIHAATAIFSHHAPKYGANTLPTAKTNTKHEQAQRQADVMATMISLDSRGRLRYAEKLWVNKDN